eukprot:TRINITY_DN7722_c0_g1_i2.p1 TRINITY_DN7722_c0_g1~~TRINITY_DN7722_c0_g1_i2.p1  ORF type:complete len:604 (-),score=45.22 TRINITY_DN7722_c0_g1_i2:57-1868(-)
MMITSFPFLLCVFMICGILSGWACDKLQETSDVDTFYIGLFALFSLTAAGTMVPLLKSVNVSLYSPEVPGCLNCVSMLIMTLILPLLLCINPDIVGITTATIASVPILPLLLLVFLNLRGIAFLLPSLLTLLTAYPVGNTWSNCLGNAGFALGLFVSIFVPYVWDQRMLMLLAFVWCCSTAAHEATADGDLFLVIAYTLESVLLYYLVVLFSRRRRRLPQALRQCRFIRLGYLRELKRVGGKIGRCQDLPPRAFGDVGKASVLIATSHRWLDRYTCDIIDETWPEGCRLSSMLARLAVTYPENLADVAGDGFWAGIRKLWNGITAGGSDVLLFFDFMSLPQIGKNPDGSLIQRTESETELFFEALPAMGAIYTMYPVLVIPEITNSVHPYFSSGWCFSEFCSSWLAQKLTQLSGRAIDDYVLWVTAHSDDTEGHQDSPPRISADMVEHFCSAVLTGVDVAEFAQMFDTELDRKRFFSEDDRSVVAGIVYGFLTLRLLTDAVKSQNQAAVKKYLADLAQRKLEHTLNHAADESLDTLLHIAARLSSAEITEMLLHSGADPNARNIRGDTPSQIFMAPRLNAAARMCRAWQSERAPDGLGYQALK